MWNLRNKTSIAKEKRLIDTENRLVVAGGDEGGDAWNRYGDEEA